MTVVKLSVSIMTVLSMRLSGEKQGFFYFVRPDFSACCGYMQCLLGYGVVYLCNLINDSTNKMVYLGILAYT